MSEAVSVSRKPLLSLVIPLLNEEDLVNPLLERVQSALKTVTLDSEIVIVNDGSVDKTLERLRIFQRGCPTLRIVNLSRNFGHQSAFMAGLSVAKGTVVVTMDGDLQDPPEVISELLTAWKQGYQVVIAARKSRKESFLRRWLFRLFYKVYAFLSDSPLPVESGVFGLLDRVAVDEMLRLEERNRYLPGLRQWVGFKSTVVWYDRKERADGKPKQSLFSLFKYAADAVFSFSYRPLRVSLFVGCAISVMSILYGFLLVVLRILKINYVQGFTTTSAAIFFFGGILLISNGILGEYLGRIYDEVKRRPLFIISEIIESSPSK